MIKKVLLIFFILSLIGIVYAAPLSSVNSTVTTNLGNYTCIEHFSPWSSWSQCTGTQQRTRVCYNCTDLCNNNITQIDTQSCSTGSSSSGSSRRRSSSSGCVPQIECEWTGCTNNIRKQICKDITSCSTYEHNTSEDCEFEPLPEVIPEPEAVCEECKICPECNCSDWVIIKEPENDTIVIDMTDEKPKLIDKIKDVDWSWVLLFAAIIFFAITLYRYMKRKNNTPRIIQQPPTQTSVSPDIQGLYDYIIKQKGRGMDKYTIIENAKKVQYNEDQIERALKAAGL